MGLHKGEKDNAILNQQGADVRERLNGDLSKTLGGSVYSRTSASGSDKGEKDNAIFFNDDGVNSGENGPAAQQPRNDASAPPLKIRAYFEFGGKLEIFSSFMIETTNKVRVNRLA